MTQFHLGFRPAFRATATGLALLVATAATAMPPGHEQMARHHGCAMPGSLAVTGQGEAQVAPDLAVITLGVTTQADSAAEAMRLNAQQQSAVVQALKAAGLAAEDIQTSGLSLNPLRDYGENREPRVTGYEASNMVSVRVREIARLGEMMDAIVAAGANQIQGIDFLREDSARTQDAARRKAVKDAMHKARVLAEAAGLTLGPVRKMREGSTGGGPQPMRMMAADMAKEASTPVEPGQLSMSAQVEVEFALLDDPAACSPHPRKHGPGKGKPSTGKPKAGDLPPPMGTDSGSVAPGQPVVPMGEDPVPGEATGN